MSCVAGFSLFGALKHYSLTVYPISFSGQEIREGGGSGKNLRQVYSDLGILIWWVPKRPVCNFFLWSYANFSHEVLPRNVDLF